MARYQMVFLPALEVELQRLAEQPNYTTTDVLACMTQPLIALRQVRLDGPVIYLRLLGYAYSEIQGHLRKFTMTHYGHVVSRFLRNDSNRESTF